MHIIIDLLIFVATMEQFRHILRLVEPVFESFGILMLFKGAALGFLKGISILYPVFV